jgi:hypothetical protein
MAERNFKTQTWAILGPKYRFFGIFWEITIEISSILRPSVEDNGVEQSQKALENLYSSSGDIWGHILGMQKLFEKVSKWSNLQS